MNYKKTAEMIVENVGGEENIASIMSCFTRVRFEVKDKEKVNESVIKGLEGVQGINWNVSTLQVIVGSHCNDIYDEVEKIVHIKEDGESIKEQTNVVAEKPSIGAVILDYVGSTIQPVVPILVAAGLVQSLLECVKKSL